MAANDVPTVLGWPELTALVHASAHAASADGTPQVVVGVLRGGMVPAVLTAHALGLRQVRAVEVVHTVADGVAAAKSRKPQVTNPGSLGDLTGADVLVVDDVAGTGETIDTTVLLAHEAGASRVRTAVCVVNNINWMRSRRDRPQQALTYIGAIVEGWVIFPWETP